ncbi:hypothetical protein ACOSP7_026638 [Xanthoceras sorbifolium]
MDCEGMFLGVEGSSIVKGIAGRDETRTSVRELTASAAYVGCEKGTEVCTEVVNASHQNVKGSLACEKKLKVRNHSQADSSYFDRQHSKNKNLKSIQQTWRH